MILHVGCISATDPPKGYVQLAGSCKVDTKPGHTRKLGFTKHSYALKQACVAYKKRAGWAAPPPICKHNALRFISCQASLHGFNKRGWGVRGVEPQIFKTILNYLSHPHPPFANTVLARWVSQRQHVLNKRRGGVEGGAAPPQCSHEALHSCKFKVGGFEASLHSLRSPPPICRQRSLTLVSTPRKPL